MRKQVYNDFGILLLQTSFMCNKDVYVCLQTNTGLTFMDNNKTKFQETAKTKRNSFHTITYCGHNEFFLLSAFFYSRIGYTLWCVWPWRQRFSPFKAIFSNISVWCIHFYIMDDRNARTNRSWIHNPRNKKTLWTLLHVSLPAPKEKMNLTEYRCANVPLLRSPRFLAFRFKKSPLSGFRLYEDSVLYFLTIDLLTCSCKFRKFCGIYSTYLIQNYLFYFIYLVQIIRSL